MVTFGQYIFLQIMRIYMYVSKILIQIYQCLESFSHKVIFMIISSYHNLNYSDNYTVTKAGQSLGMRSGDRARSRVQIHSWNSLTEGCISRLRNSSRRKSTPSLSACNRPLPQYINVPMTGLGLAHWACAPCLNYYLCLFLKNLTA